MVKRTSEHSSYSQVGKQANKQANNNGQSEQTIKRAKRANNQEGKARIHSAHHSALSGQASKQTSKQSSGQSEQTIKRAKRAYNQEGKARIHSAHHSKEALGSGQGSKRASERTIELLVYLFFLDVIFLFYCLLKEFFFTPLPGHIPNALDSEHDVACDRNLWHWYQWYVTVPCDFITYGVMSTL